MGRMKEGDKNIDFSWEFMKFIKKGSDFSWEVLKFRKKVVERLGVLDMVVENVCFTKCF